MKRVTLVSLTVCLILVIVSGTSVSTLADIASETVTKAEQHFEKANELLNRKEYKAAVAEFEEVMNISPNSKIAQDAQYWMGQSHFMAGQFDAAQATFAKLIEQYPASAIVPATELMVERVGRAKDIEEKKRAIAEARMRLAALQRDIGNPELTVRQVWSFNEPGDEPQSDYSGAPSPDGRYLSFTNWSYGNLAVRDLTTGKDRDLTDEGTWDEPDQWAGGSVWSPDGKQIAYNWYNEYHWELRIVGFDGSGPRVLYRNKEMKVVHPNGIRPFAWSQDGKYILVRFLKRPDPNERVWEIVLVSATDGSVRVLKSLKGLNRWPRHHMSLSPDGRYVVYARKVEEDKGESDLFLLATDGSGDEVPLMEHPADEYGPVWAPDGKTIVFVSYRSGTCDAWLMQVADGKPVGEPQLVRRDTGEMSPMGFTREGSLYYGLSADSTDVYVASIDPSTGKLLAPPAKAIRQFEGRNDSPAWSPDGKSLAYVSVRPSPGSSRRRRILVIRSVETGQERELYPEALLQHLRWSPDGRSILCGRSLQLINVKTGDVSGLVQFDPANTIRIIDAAWSPDGKAVFYIYIRTAVGAVMRIRAHDLETGKEKELRQGRVCWPGLAVSPDGLQLAFTSWDEVGWALMAMPAAGGESRILHRLQPQEGHFGFNCPPTWTADGRYVLFGKRNSELWCVAAEGGESQKVLAMDGLSEVSVHPDGRRIAFTGGWREIGEVWVMENFLPEATTSK